MSIEISGAAAGRVVGSLDGYYSVRLDGGGDVRCRPRGVFRKDGVAVAVGDRVTVKGHGSDTAEAVIDSVTARRNLLIRPPIANVDRLLIMIAAARPDPVPLVTDKLISVAEHNSIEPVIVISKADLAPGRAGELEAEYRSSGFTVFVCAHGDDSGPAALKGYIAENPASVTAFAGASGVGKSTMIGRLFPMYSADRRQGDVSRRGRGRHTTREVTLHAISDEGESGEPLWLADTPGFSLIDMERFDFFELDDLPFTFREFLPYLGKCRYSDCRHLKDEGCAVLSAMEEGRIDPRRHESYAAMYGELKDKKPWDKKRQ